MKIICIGRNYADHAKELGNAVPDAPLFFLKPDSAVLPHRHPFFIPEWTEDVHYEVELIVKMDRLGKYIQEAHAPRYYSAVSLGIDFTARDIQRQCKANGHPWEKAKAFDGSAVVPRTFIPLTELDKPIQELSFRLEKNGIVVQTGYTGDMLFSVDQLIAYTSQYMMVKMGDLLFTGTPSGVGPVAIGDQLTGFLEDRELFSVSIK